MKTKTKALVLACCAVLLVVTTVFVTVAYLTDTDTVTNTFTVGNVSITLDEAKVGTDGKKIDGEGAERVKTNSYKLVPGRVVDKDPTVTVLSGSETAYIRMLVTVNKKDALDAIGVSDLTAVFGGYNSSNWTYVENVEDETNDQRVYEFRYKETVSGANGNVVLDALFDTVTVPGAITSEQMKTLSDLEIKVVANAIQAEGFADANAAWSAFDGR